MQTNTKKLKLFNKCASYYISPSAKTNHLKRTKRSYENKAQIKIKKRCECWKRLGSGIKMSSFKSLFPIISVSIQRERSVCDNQSGGARNRRRQPIKTLFHSLQPASGPPFNLCAGSTDWLRCHEHLSAHTQTDSAGVKSRIVWPAAGEWWNRRSVGGDCKSASQSWDGARKSWGQLHIKSPCACLIYKERTCQESRDRISHSDTPRALSKSFICQAETPKEIIWLCSSLVSMRMRLDPSQLLH